MLQTANDDAPRPVVGSFSHKQNFMAGSIQTRQGAGALRNTTMRDEERRAKELQFQMRLLKAMISDGVPRHRQPDWASAFHRSASLIQRKWRVHKKKLQAQKITEIMDDTINVFMEQTNWGGWEVVNDPFKLLAARQAAELDGSETDSDYSDSDTSSSEASDDWSDSEDDDGGSGGEGGVCAGGSDDNDRHADFHDGENEDDELLRQRRRANNFDGDGDSVIPGRSIQKRRHPLPSKAQSKVALMLRDMNNRLKDQLSRASSGQDIDAVSRMSRKILRVGTSLTALQEVDGRTEQQGSSDRSSAMYDGDKSGQNPNDGGKRSSAMSNSKSKLGPGDKGNRSGALQDGDVRAAQQGSSSDRSSAMSNGDKSGQDPNSRGKRSSSKSKDKSRHSQGNEGDEGNSRSGALQEGDVRTAQQGSSDRSGAKSKDKSKHGSGNEGDEGNRSRAKKVMALFKMAARAVGKVNDNLKRLRNHQASVAADGQKCGADEDQADAVCNDIKKYARRARFQVKGLQDAMVAELKRTPGEQGIEDVLKDTESAQELINNRLTLLTSLADDTGGYNGIVLAPAGEGPVNGSKFDAMHKELADLCSSINKVKKEIKQNSKTTIVRDRPAKPKNRSPFRASFSLSPGLVDGSAALRQASSSPPPRQPSAATKSRAESPADGRKRLDPIPQDRISTQQRTLVFTDEKSNIPACQVAPFHEATANSIQYLPPMKQKRGDVPTGSSLHPGDIGSRRFSIDDILHAQRHRELHEQRLLPLRRRGRNCCSSDLGKDLSAMKPPGQLKFARSSAGSLRNSKSLQDNFRRSTVDMPNYLKGHAVEIRA